MFTLRCLGFSMVLFCLLAFIISDCQAQQGNAFPPPKNVGDPAKLGLGIQRTMTLLATSTPQHRNTVRILFYGQSITEQNWWHDVADDLRRRFPNANLLIENRALGGFSSQLLVKTAESDLYPFTPDLMIFHVYGAHDNYEDIIRRTRERTTSEVLIQTDHVTRDEDLTEETDPAHIRLEGKMWNSFMNYQHLPTLAKKYGCGIVDQRNLWKAYLRDYHLHAAQLLQDGVHQNAWGNYLMSELVKAYLVKRKDTRIDPMNCATIHIYTVGKDVSWKNGKLVLPFEGNRVDLILKAGNPAPVTMHIDGKLPSEFPQVYYFTRALATPGGKWPVILKLGWEKIPLQEDWTMEVTKDSDNPKQFTFTLAGSQTGPDGAGHSDQRFVSKSGRIVIEPQDWNVEYSLALPGIKPVPDKFTVHWKVVAQCADAFSSSDIGDKTTEHTITVAQGLPPGKHTLEVSAEPNAPVAAVRVYRPPFAPEATPAPKVAAHSAPIRILPLGDSITQGGRQDRAEYSYRYPLYYLLRDAGVNVDFIGSLHEGLNAGFVWPDKNGVPFDLDHEGHYGWKTGQARDHLRAWMQTYPAPPDIVLLHLGTNDQNAPDYQQAILQPMQDMVAMLREKNPRVVVLIGHLNFNGGAALKIRPLVEELAKRLNTAQSPVRTVAHYEGWHEKPDDPDSDTFDWAHPNPQGQRKMAQKWFDAMKPYLGRLQAQRSKLASRQ